MSNKRKLRGGVDVAKAYRRAYRCGHCHGRLHNTSEGPAVIHDDTCPVLLGLVDEGAAGRRAAAKVAEQTGVPTAHASVFSRPPPESRSMYLSGGVVGRMLRRCLAELPTMAECRHLGDVGGNAEVAFWVAWRPRSLYCLACYGAAQMRVQGTREDARCDACGHVAADGRIHSLTGEVPRAPRALSMHIGLCNACHALDAATSL